MKETQKQRLLNKFQERGSKGLFVYEIMQSNPEGLGIAQYNARIKELREDGYNIINTKPGHFVLEQSSVVDTSTISEETREKKLKELKIDWTKAKRSGDQGKMKIIEIRAKWLKEQPTDFISEVQEALL